MKKYGFEDSEIIYDYLKTNSTAKTAKNFKCSDETIRRVLIRNNIKRVRERPKAISRPKATEKELQQIVEDYYRIGGTINDIAKIYHRSQDTVRNAIRKYGHGIKFCERNSPRITNDELFAEICKGNNCKAIAKQYNTTPETIYRRARKLGIKISSVGWGGHWFERCTHYGRCENFDDTITLDAVITKYDGICQLCGQKVDKTNIVNGHIRKNYPTVDHIIPLSKGGTHTWDNVQLAHMGCNSGKCDRIDYTAKTKEV